MNDRETLVSALKKALYGSPQEKLEAEGVLLQEEMRGANRGANDTRFFWADSSDARTSLLSCEGINERDNAYGQLLSTHASSPDGIPVICGHGGSMWLCRSCAEKFWNEQELRAPRRVTTELTFPKKGGDLQLP